MQALQIGRTMDFFSSNIVNLWSAGALNELYKNSLNERPAMMS